MRKTMLCLALLAAVFFAAAQEKLLSGKITDSRDGKPMAGVTVTVKGTNVTTTTNSDGTYQLRISAKDPVLLFSYVGFATEEVSAAGKTSLNLALNTEEKALREVTVVAYGTQKKKDITSSVSVVNSEAIKRQQVVSVGQALQGTAAGVMVVNTSGQPGDNPTLRIRGIASINASANPLIVVDGVPFDGNLNMINPNDIDNFSILKDATATALYGSRAANGVVMINTKNGKKGGKAQINVSSTYGWSSRALPEYSFTNSQQIFELSWEALKNLYATVPTIPNAAQQASADLVSELKYNPYKVAEPVGTDGKLKAGLSPVWNTNWVDELTRETAARQDHNINISGGSDKSTYFFSTGYIDQQGYLITSQYKRVNSRFNFTTDVNNWLQLGLRSQYVYSDQNYPNQNGNSFDNVVQYYRQMSSIYPVYQFDDQGQLIFDANGNKQWDFGTPIPGRTVNANRNTLQPSNLIATTHANTNRNQRNLTSVNGFAVAKILDGLTFRTQFGLDRYAFESLAYENPDFGNGVNVGGRIARQMDATTSYTWNNMLNYKKRFGSHNIELMASHEAYKYQFQVISGSKTGFPFGGLTNFNNAAINEALNGYSDNLAIQSYLGRVKYDFRGKYFVEATIRRDGSSRFNTENRWGTFPSVGASWVVTEENFVQKLDWLNLFKIRASYGEIGNEALVSYFPYLSAYSTGYDELTKPGIFLDQLGNPNIKWEKQGNFNVGVDFAVLKNRITGTVEYFKKSSLDLLFKLPLVYSGGIPSVDFNIGDMTNSGVEVQLNGTIVKTKDITWEAGVNATWVKNRLNKLPQAKLLNGAYQLEVGHSLFDFYIPTWAGVDPADGKGMWYQDEVVAGQPTGKQVTVKTYAQATRYYQGTALPTVTGGFNTRFNYKGFDASVLLNYALGGKYYDVSYNGLLNGISASLGDQLSSDILGRWQKPGDITDIPALDLNNTDYAQRSTRYLFDGDYLRLRNITLGYTFNPRTKKEFLRSARFFVQADNLGTWSKLKTGADPEANINGQSALTTSVFKTVSVGIEIGL
ncbi:MAG: TonB-dependent receptor [Bacteroidota bacterium]